MVNPRSTAVLIQAKVGGNFTDKTEEVENWTATEQGFRVTFANNGTPKSYTYSARRVMVLENPSPCSLDGSVIAVDGEVWRATEVVRFEHPKGAWVRIFYPTQTGGNHRIYQATRVQILHDAGAHPRASQILRYWRNAVNLMPDLDGNKNPLRRAYDGFRYVNTESALAHFISGAAIEERPLGHLPIFPFSSNISQREALLKAVSFPVSVINGPPGTGKTQTILNLVATLTATPDVTVGVVSSNNSAVRNVREKLEKEKFDFILAGLGNKKNKEEFFSAQTTRNQSLESFMSNTEGAATESTVSLKDKLEEITHEINSLQEKQRLLAKARQELDAHRLEERHFHRYLEGHEVKDLDGVELINLDSRRILDYLAETQLEDESPSWPLRWARRLKQLAKYGMLKGIDPQNTAIVLSLQRAYYNQKILELTETTAVLESDIMAGDLEGLLRQQRDLSLQFFCEKLRDRYSQILRKTYNLDNYVKDFRSFSVDYPVILSTCQSLPKSIGTGHLLDYVIIDEASQVDLLSAALALGSAKRAVIVGDLNQLSYIAESSVIENIQEAPKEAYDYGKHSLLSSVQAVYGDSLPSTTLREHYRCDPAIIGFCNEKFYKGQLIPFTRPSPGNQALILYTTSEGNHMRQHRTGGRSNEREIDVIEREIIPSFCEGLDRQDIAVTSPYRKQVDKINGLLVSELVEIQANTVHKFQGGERSAVIMSTVLDETWRGRTGTQFVDNPNLVNVAVSRAIEKFILVTNHEMMPESSNLRDLMEYIRYHDPDNLPHRSDIVSVFDLLYRDFSESLRPLLDRLEEKSKYKSENIIWTVLQEILAEEKYEPLELRPQIVVRNLLQNLDGLTHAEATYVENRCSLDFVIHRRVTREALLAIEVNGFAFHENKPDQHAKDLLKQSILRKKGIPLLSLSTTGSGEESRIRDALDAVTDRRR